MLKISHSSPVAVFVPFVGAKPTMMLRVMARDVMAVVTAVPAVS